MKKEPVLSAYLNKWEQMEYFARLKGNRDIHNYAMELWAINPSEDKLKRIKLEDEKRSKELDVWVQKKLDKWKRKPLNRLKIFLGLL